MLAWARARRAAGTAGWRGTDALVRGAVGGLGLVALGVVLHRFELLLIGAPLLVSTVLALAVPVGEAPVPKAERLPRTVEAGDDARLTIRVDAGPGVEFLAVRLPTPDNPAVGPVQLLPGQVHAVRARLRWNAWGEGVDVRPDHLAAGRDALLISGPVTGSESRRTVLPPVTALPPGPLPSRIAGLVGVHRSARPGDGTELRAIRPFQPGDRVRRVDWRVTLRAGAATGQLLGPGTLHVRERHAEADAELVLAIDSRTDVVPEIAKWSSGDGDAAVRPGGTLDASVRAVAALAAGFLRQGDRVGLVDLGRPQLGLAPGVGHRHLLRIRHQLVACSRSAGWAPKPVLRQVPSGAVVLVLSPFLDDAIADCVLHAARRGQRVMAVDMLPRLVPDTASAWGEVVRQIVAGEHRARLAAIRGQGVPVLSWSDGATVAATLRRLRRRR
ncbi:POSSIBLE CONSERVED SECRETED PROTEIN [Alloactinosynnema sp. L-07]|nr:POSSIBLE CONSERVED SECRETED PROTEIN [Alloactinosynnema sp. L-07]